MLVTQPRPTKKTPKKIVKTIVEEVSKSKFQLAREKAGLTQKELAKIMGVTINTISGWENIRPPSMTPEKTLRLCHTLNISLDELASFYEEETEA